MSSMEKKVNRFFLRNAFLHDIESHLISVKITSTTIKITKFKKMKTFKIQ